MIHEGVELFEKYNYKSQYAPGYLGLGGFYNNAGRKEKALEYLMKAEPLFEEMEMDFSLAQMHKVYHKFYSNEGDQSKAREHLTKAIDIMKGLGAYGWVERYEKELAELH